MMAESTSLTLLGVFLAGFASSLTPCVYPLIPITLALFGARTETSRLKAFGLSICYVLGIATTYTVLGIFSAYTGALFGSFQSNPIVIMTVSAFMIYLALCMLEITRFSLGSGLQSKASQVGGKGFGGAYLMGAASGIIAAPCVGPVLAAILAKAATTKDLFQGGLLLFTYSIGLGMIFIILGTYSNLITKIPKSGGWLSAVKYLMAAALLIATWSLAWPLLPDWSEEFSRNQILLGSSLLILLCASIGVLSFKKNIAALKFLSCFVLSFAAFNFYSTYERPAIAIEIAWQDSLESALDQAKTSNKIVFVDLYADWCTACVEMGKKTFPDSAVQAAFKSFVLAKVDFTDPESEYNTKLAAKYSVSGLPTMMFIRPDGSEIREKRLEGFLPPAEFLAKLAELR